jgi:hypothetical protein
MPILRVDGQHAGSGRFAEQTAGDDFVFCARCAEGELVVGHIEDTMLREDDGSVDEDGEGEVRVDDDGEAAGLTGEGARIVLRSARGAFVGEAGGVVEPLRDVESAGGNRDGEAGVRASEDPVECGVLRQWSLEFDGAAEEDGELPVEVGARDFVGTAPAGSPGAVGEEAETGRRLLRRSVKSRKCDGLLRANWSGSGGEQAEACEKDANGEQQSKTPGKQR